MRVVLLPVLAAILVGPPAVAATLPPPRHVVPHRPVVHRPVAHHPVAHAAMRRHERAVPPHRRVLPAHHAATTAAAAAVAAEAARHVPAAPAPKVVGSVTGLLLPRFASLRSDEVNLRSGPGTRYPIEWVYKKRDLPVEIEREYDVWRLVEDRDGTKGWVHQATLIGTRTFVVASPAGSPGAAVSPNPAVSPSPAEPDTAAPDLSAGTAPLRRTAADEGAALAYLKPGVIGRIVACAPDSAWCRVTVHGIGGYLRREELWGVLPGEAVGGG